MCDTAALLLLTNPGVMPGPSSVDTVIVGLIAPDLSNASHEERTRIVVAGHRGDTDAARSGLDHADPDVRGAALGALARCNALTVADLNAHVDDPSPSLRRRVAEEAGRLTTDDGRPVAARLITDADHSVVEMAAWALGERPSRRQDIAPLCTIAVDHEESLCREAAVAALGALGQQAGLSAILTATGDKATVRRRAILALAAFDGPEVEAALTAALNDRDWQVRQAAEDLGAVPSPDAQRPG